MSMMLATIFGLITSNICSWLLIWKLMCEIFTFERQVILGLKEKCKKKTASVEKEQKRTDSFGFAGRKYNQLIVFRNEEAFLEVLAANPHMEAIIGASPDSKRDFPGVYIAGVKAN